MRLPIGEDAPLLTPIVQEGEFILCKGELGSRPVQYEICSRCTQPASILGMGYWRQFLTRFWKDFRAATGEQVIGALLALGILFYQIKFGIIHSAEVNASYWAVFWPYVFLTAALFIWHLMRTPYLLHKEAEEMHLKQMTVAMEQGKAVQRGLIAFLPTQAEWLGLADRFKCLPYVQADWFTERQLTRWTLRDSAARSLCTLAGSMLLKSHLIESQYPHLLSHSDHLERWLSYLKEIRPSTNYLVGESDLPDGSKLFSYMGSVEVSNNSKDICIELAAHSGTAGLS